jgi:hypothetical protein
MKMQPKNKGSFSKLAFGSQTIHVLVKIWFSMASRHLCTIIFLKAVSSLQELPVDLTAGVPSQIPNWDIVSDIVNLNSRMYRSPRQVSST